METQERMNLRKKPLAAFLCLSIGVIPTVTGQQPTAAGAASNDACSDAAAEASLQQRETALLGVKHANEHANARAKQCRVAKGLEKVSTADPTILAAAAKQPTSSMGQWASPIHIPVAGITSVLLNNGQVLFWSYDPTQWGNNASNTGVAYLWDPVKNVGHSIAAPENIWCGGQTILSDGRVYLAGGNLRYPDSTAPAGQTGWEGALSHYTFNPNTATFTKQIPDMSTGRWYPTTTQLADNRVVITSGYDQSGSEYLTPVVEVFTPSASMDGNGTITAISPHAPSGLYPFQYLLTSGKMLQAGPDQTNTTLLSADTWNWSKIPEMQFSHYVNGNGLVYTDASVTPAKQVVLIAGGSSGHAVIGNIDMLDGTNPNAGWKAFPSWLQGRHNSNTVILADGTLFTVGGNNATTTYDNPLFESELYTKAPSDTSGSWVQVMPHTIQAAYHSSAILLPDATVLLSQDDQDRSATAHMVQVYSPPYLFKGSRPQITSAPTTATWGQTVAVGTDTSKISSAMLIAPGATTHGNDMHQRAIRLASRITGRSLQVTIPASSSLVPPGYYMLFILNASGVPSVAKFMRIS
ncbi:galactose oxidase-like domain-containing protein [Massilia sp. LXY-6]|uniref:galactose oxidase-like domain-containing protein n=1 Tax=Massilia sp. LXY-6 TaxID=3379823 RepID=UPI003EDFAE37